ncbi:hypothetical protein IJD34_02525 [bacterium]|nr:hypothetical protein [bacterium]
MATKGYKKYMKNNVKKDYSLVKLFVISFFGMLLVSTYLFKSFIPPVDVSIGDYQQETEPENITEIKNSIDNRLALIQDEDQGRSFSEMMRGVKDEKEEPNLPALSKSKKEKDIEKETKQEQMTNTVQTSDINPIYKVYIGTYTSAEQAKVAKDIILETGSALNPIVKCIGSNNYTLQVGIFKNKQSAESLLFSIQQSNLPGRLVQEF